jgi:16S rRNA (guanine1207-N2)-methyltransferase
VADGPFDLALAVVPKGRAACRAVLVTALDALRDGGTLLVAGPSRGGVRTAQTDAAAVGCAVEHLASAQGHRVFRVTRHAPPRPPAEWESPWLPRPLHIVINDAGYDLTTQPGVFCWDHLDDGTAFLVNALSAADRAPAQRVLDAGCGYGILGLFAQRQLGATTVTWCDHDLLAVACTRATVGAAQVLAADLTDQPPRALAGMDLILCNPPFHTGHDQDTSFLPAFARQARHLLAPGGRLVIVANRFLPYHDGLATHLGPVTRLAADGRFQVLEAIPSDR